MWQGASASNSQSYQAVKLLKPNATGIFSGRETMAAAIEAAIEEEIPLIVAVATRKKSLV